MTQFDASDDGLAQRFSAWRTLEASRAPSMGRVLARNRRLPRRRWGAAAFALGALAVAVVAGWRISRATPAVSPEELAVSALSLRGPTDFLLDQSAGLRAGAIPAIGSIDWYPLAFPSDSSTDASRRRN